MQPNTRPPQHTNYPLEVDDTHVIELMQNFHRGLSDLQNEFCGTCKECFPTIKTNEVGLCNCCRTDAQLPKLFTPENNMDPGSVPTELCVSSII